MADSANIKEKDIINRVQLALDHQKSFFLCKTSNKYVLKDVSVTFEELKSRSKDIIQAKFGPLRERHEHELALVFPILERTMKRVKIGIMRRLSERMSKCHPWRIILDAALPEEAFMVLKNNILGITSYGLEIEQDSKCVKIIFTSLRRFVQMFNKFEECPGFEKNVKYGDGKLKLIIDEKNKGVISYKLKDELLQFDLHYAHINKYGLKQR